MEPVIFPGLRIARSFLGEVLDMGIPTATELLDPITPQYLGRLPELGCDWSTHIRIPNSSPDGIGIIDARGI